ncbi:MFS transporter [Protaetiibacter mangrovi]|uniref:MFS transporter n=1 Tax=Protaetiibacter mangrovi TaxID=2970926 RepID=A0ABT1ZG87_9MICO|nr:MFS transporter [Protaetiibacter mangrovi]MCS0499699.1 MFS transporter [Protaetiibacter mangrovi]TPX04826.1 MFS transporter [Schumannella luteola]
MTNDNTTTTPPAASTPPGVPTVTAAIRHGDLDRTGGVPRRKTNLVILGGSMVADGGEGSMATTLFPVIAAALSLATSALGILSAVGRIVGVFAGPTWVFLAKKFGRKPILAIATGFWGVWAVAAGFSQDFAQLLVLYAIMAAGTAAAHAIVPEVIGDSFEDKKRGRVVGWLYGGTAAIGSVMAPLIGQLANVEDGWRYGFFVFGAINVLFGVLILAFYKDPGTGGGEEQLKTFSQAERDAASKITWAKVRSLLRIRSYVILLGSRLLSSHLLLAAFGVVLLVQEFGFDTAVAASVMAPFGIGYLLGTIVGGFLSDLLNRLSPDFGRVGMLQGAQLAFAVVAFFTTQFVYGGILPYLVLFGIVGLTVGLNPGVNRPLVMAVVPPELRGAAFAIFVSIIESIGFAIYTLTAGFLADTVGLQTVMLWLVCGIMVVNAAYLTLLYGPYKRDRRALEAELDARRERILESEAAAASGD